MDSNKSNGKETKKHKKYLGELKIIKNISAKMKKQDEENSSYFGKKWNFFLMKWKKTEKGSTIFSPLFKLM